MKLTVEELKDLALRGTAPLVGYEEGGYGPNSIIRDRDGETLTFQDFNEAYTPLERNSGKAVSVYLATLDMDKEECKKIMEVMHTGVGNDKGLVYSLDEFNLDTLDVTHGAAIYDIKELAHWRNGKMDIKGYRKHTRNALIDRTTKHLEGIRTAKQLQNRKAYLAKQLAKFD